MKKASRSANKNISTACFLGFFITLICFMLSGKIPLWMGADEEILHMSSVYMAFMSLSFIVNLIGTSCSSTLRCTGETKVPLIINTVSIIINVILNALFIFPSGEITFMERTFLIWGADKGVGGAAFATFVSIGISTVFLFWAVYKNKRGIHISLSEIFSRKKDDIILYKRAFSIGMPIFLERLTINSGQMLYMRCISTMGTASIAAHHLAVQAESFSYMPITGIQVAIQTLMSQSMGAKRLDDGEKFSKFSAKAGFYYGLFAGIILFLFGKPIMNIFTPDEAIAEMGAQLLKIVAFAEEIQALNIVYSGCLRGIGETKMPFYIGLAGIWGIRIGLCSFTTFALHLGIHAAWFAMAVDMCFRGIATTVCFTKRFNRLKDKNSQ